MPRRLAGIAVFAAQLPVLLTLAALTVIAFKNLEMPSGLYLLGLPVMGLSAGCFFGLPHSCCFHFFPGTDSFGLQVCCSCGRKAAKSKLLAQKSLAYVPEQPDLTSYATSREILSLVCRLRNKLLEKGMEAPGFLGLCKLAPRTVRELSLGQRRGAVFAAVLIGDPRYILLDEPLEGMHRKIKEEIIAWISSPLPKHP